MTKAGTGKQLRIVGTISDNRIPARDCVEQGRYCMRRFVPSRVGQTDTCTKCMEMLDGECPPLLKSTRKSRNIWS